MIESKDNEKLKLVRKLRGAPGTKVQIAVRRHGAESPLTFDLVREQIKVASVVGKRLASNILYLRLKQFQEGTHQELVTAHVKLPQEAPAPTGPASSTVTSQPARCRK